MMTGYLKEKLGEVDRDAVIKDTVSLIDDEVSRKGGLSGMALKTGYKAVKKLQNGRMIEKAVNRLLDDFTDALAPLHDDYREQDSVKGFDKFLSSKSDEAASALLSITDKRAERADHKVLRSTYNKLRGQAQKHVVDALPGVGRLIDKHVPN